MPSVLNTVESGSVIHVRFAGTRCDIPLASLDLEATSSDAQIKLGIAARLMIPTDWLSDYTIDRHADGDLTLRPDIARYQGAD